MVLQVGQAIGGWLTAGLVVAFSVVGAVLLRIETARAWSDFRTALAEGRWPGDEVAQGALIIVGGTLLVTPGFVTDFVGFVLLIGPTRRLVARGVRRRVAADGAVAAPGTTAGSTGGPQTGTASGTPHRARGSFTSSAEELEIEVVEIRREQGSDDER